MVSLLSSFHGAKCLPVGMNPREETPTPWALLQPHGSGLLHPLPWLCSPPHSSLSTTPSLCLTAFAQVALSSWTPHPLCFLANSYLKYLSQLSPKTTFPDNALLPQLLIWVRDPSVLPQIAPTTWCRSGNLPIFLPLWVVDSLRAGLLFPVLT